MRFVGWEDDSIRKFVVTIGGTATVRDEFIAVDSM